MTREQRDFDHQWHVNINRRNEKLGGIGTGKWEHWTYEAKSMLAALSYLPEMFKKEREGTLPQTFKYCSRSETEKLPVKNQLMCCLGVKTSECEILRDCFADMEKFPLEMIDSAKAHVCIAHILTELGSGKFIDTSEGYILDETERQFWQTTYHYMSMGDPDAENQCSMCDGSGYTDHVEYGRVACSECNDAEVSQ